MRGALWLGRAVSAVALATGTVAAEVSMPSIFGNHMVLQQGESIPVWGWADPGEAVAVSLSGRMVDTMADESGHWRVDLRKQKAGGPHQLRVTGDGNELLFDDVLIGEVWVGSGQSNMQWPVNRSANPDAEIAAANHPGIRLFSVELKASTTPEENCKGTWQVCSPETIPDFSAVLYYFGRELHQELERPVGLINTSWGGTPAEAWTSRPALEAEPALRYLVEKWDQIVADYPAAKAAHEQAMAEWSAAVEAAKAAGAEAPAKPKEPQGPHSSWLAAGLFNQMIAPLTPFAIQGAVWYQGESNAGRAHEYRTLFPVMIQSWRDDWGQGDFPFYFVQLANFKERAAEPGDSDWAELREAQTMTLSLPNTGMATIIDIGDAKDIHPTNKQDVGKRLARHALAKDYRKRVVYSGPSYKSHRVDGNEVTLSFEHVDGGLRAEGGELTGFAVAGADRKFVWASARIEGRKVVVSSPEVAEPVALRYGWADNPACNLYNEAGLPAVPFRTDDWPGITEGKQ